MQYSYAPLSRRLFVTIKEYNRAFRLIEMIENADPRPMLAIMARFMEANSRVGGLVRSAHDAVTGFPWDIVPSDPKNNAAVAIAAATKERFVSSGVHHNFDVIMDGEFYGVTALRQIWNNVNGKMQADLDVVASTDLFRKKNDKGKFDVVLIENSDTTFKTTLIPPAERVQYIISEFNPFKSTRPGFIGGILRSAIPLTIIKNFSWQDWSQFVEIFGQPFRTAEYKAGTSNEDKAVAREALEEFGKNAWALVSEDIKFQLQEAARSGNVTAYENLQKAIDSELDILINGEANTTQLPTQGGSRAALQVMKLITDDRMWWRLNNVEEIINEQHINIDYRLNESETDLTLRPKFKFLTDEAEDRESNARIVSDLTTCGFTLDDAEVTAKTGFKVTGANSRPATGAPSPTGGTPA
jgi:hypothetical protein